MASIKTYTFDPITEHTKFQKITYKMYKTEKSLSIAFARVYVDEKYTLGAIVNSKKSDKSYNIILLNYNSKNKEAKKWFEILNLENSQSLELGEELVNKMKKIHENPKQEYSWYKSFKHKAKPKPGIYDKDQMVDVEIISFE